MLGLLLVLAWVGLQQAPPSAATAGIAGSVVDREGGPLPGVTVSLEAAGATVRKVVTTRDGAYRLEPIAPGTYNVKFELAGFQTYTRTRLTLTAGQSHTMKVGLDVGDLFDHGPRASLPLPPRPVLNLTDAEVGVGVETTVGTFYIAVDTRRAPITAANFLKYVEAGLYNSGRFHRATRPDNYTPAPPARPMMNIIQGGINPARRSEGFPAIPLERTSVTGIKHVTGVVSMARGTAADTATSDFFVLLDDQPSLDFGGQRFEDGQGGAAFGRIVEGLEVVRRIQQQPADGQNLSAPVTIWRVWRLGPK